MSKDNRFLIGLSFALLLPCLGLISLGASQPKFLGSLNLCNLKPGDRGIIKGIVLRVEKAGNRARVSITEGTQGCEVAISQRYTQVGDMNTPGNRISIPVKVINEGSVEGLGFPKLDSTVVDTQGNIETPASLKIKISSKPDNQDPYLRVRMRNENTGIIHTKAFKLSPGLLNEVRTGKATIFYSPSTFEVLKIEY